MVTPAPTTAIGHGLGGGGQTHGFPWDPTEHTPELAWPLSIAVFDKMRRQDAQTKSVLNAVTLPIRRATWRLDPNGAPDNVVAAIAGDLGLPILDADDETTRPRRRQRFDWHEHIRLALLALPYGHMIFEKVGEIGADGLWHLTRLEERLPATIAKINTARNGDLIGVEQYSSGLVGDTGIGLPIPAERLVFYSHEREGGLWQGQSILRSSYKHWLLKDRLIRADAMKHERNGMGIPVAIAPENASDKQIERLHDIVTKWRAGEVSGAGLPYGTVLRLVGVEGTLPDTLASIRYHDEQTAQETLAMFMKLGSSATGSRALGSEFVDFFMLSLQAAADELGNTFNEQQIEVWVDWNWGPDTPAPRVVVEPIGADTDIAAEAIKALLDSGALTPDDGLEKYLRERYRLPARDEDADPDPPTPKGAAGRRRRPFPRTAHASTEANPDWPGGPYLDQLTGHYAPLIATALETAFDVDTIAAEFLAPAAQLASDEDINRARGYVGGITPDDAALIDLLREILGDAYIAGMHVSEAMLRAADVIVREQPWDADIDWDTWEPGHARAAAEIAGRDGGRGLARLLAEADATITGIDATTLDGIAAQLATALEKGWSVDQAAAGLSDYLTDPARAEKIAQTEMARAMTVASLDLYDAHGVTGRTWLLSVGACPRCVENERAGPVALDEDFPNGDPPVHPHCVCAIAPVIDDDYPLDPEAALPAPTVDRIGDEFRRFTSAGQRRYAGTVDALSDVHGLPRLDDEVYELRDAGRGDLGRIVLRTGRASNKGGHFSPYARGGMEIRVNVRPGVDDSHLSLLHEIGHWIDFRGVPGSGFYTERSLQRHREVIVGVPVRDDDVVRGDAVFDLMTAIRGTDAYQKLISADTIRATGRAWVNYATRPVELWARAYSQWAANWIGGDALTGLRDRLQGNPFGYQWTDEEFELLAPHVEAVLRERGLLE